MKKNYLPEIEIIRNWYITALGFLASKIPSQKISFETSIEIIKNTTIENNIRMLKGFREGQSDLAEMALALPTHEDYLELDKLLTEKYCLGLTSLIQKQDKLIRKIIKKNTITNDEEWRLVNEIVNNVAQKNYTEAQIQVFKKILLDNEIVKQNNNGTNVF